MTDRGATVPKLPKRWRRKARGGSPKGWISKTALDEPGDEISASESGSCSHTRPHVLARGTQAVGEERRVATCG